MKLTPFIPVFSEENIRSNRFKVNNKLGNSRTARYHLKITLKIFVGLMICHQLTAGGARCGVERMIILG